MSAPRFHSPPKSSERRLDDEGLGKEISQLSEEINGLYRFVSSKSSPSPALIYDSSSVDNIVSELISDIYGAPDSETARDIFDSVFQERLSSMNSLDVLKRLVRELCMSTFRNIGSESSRTPLSTEGGAAESRSTRSMHQSFSSATVASPSINSELLMGTRQSMLGTVHIPRPPLISSPRGHTTFDGDSGSDVPSETTSDGSSSDAEVDEDPGVVAGWREALAGTGSDPSHLDLFNSLQIMTDSAGESAVSSAFELERVQKDPPRQVTMPLQSPSSKVSPIRTATAGDHRSPASGVAAISRTRVGDRRSPRTPPAAAPSSSPARTICKQVQKGYLTDIINSLPSHCFQIVQSPVSNKPVRLFSDILCDVVAAEVTAILGLSSDVYAESEVVRPVINMFIGSALDQQTVSVMEEMIGSSLKAYESNNPVADGTRISPSSRIQRHFTVPFNDSDDDDDLGYDSPNDISSQNLHRTLHTIMSEEKDKRESDYAQTRDRGLQGQSRLVKTPAKEAALNNSSSSYNRDARHSEQQQQDPSIEVWDVQKSPMDHMFRQRFGGLGDPLLEEIYAGNEDSDCTDEHSELLPAWNDPKSPMDHVFRKRHGGLGEPVLTLDVENEDDGDSEIDSIDIDRESNEHANEFARNNLDGSEYQDAWKIPKSPMDTLFRKRVGGLGDSPSGVLNAQTGEFVPGKDFPAEEDLGEIHPDDIPANFGLPAASIKWGESYNDTSSRSDEDDRYNLVDGEDIEEGSDRSDCELESIDLEYKPRSLLTFDGRIGSERDRTEKNSRSGVTLKAALPAAAKRTKRKVKTKFKKSPLTSSAVESTNSWNALISPHSNFLKLQKSMQPNQPPTIARVRQAAGSGEFARVVNADPPKTTLQRQQQKKKKPKTRIGAKRVEATTLTNGYAGAGSALEPPNFFYKQAVSIANGSVGRSFSTRKSDHQVSSSSSAGTAAVDRARQRTIEYTARSARAAAVEPNKHTDKRLGGVPEKHAVVPHTKSTRKRSSKTSKIACTFDNPTIYSSSGEPASAYTGVYAGSSGVALATAGNELILAADDIDPRSHPVVRSSQAAFLNQSSSRSGNPSYFSVYGLDADYDSDASSEDFDPFASEPILEFDRGVSNSYFASSFTGNKTSGTNRA